jgi:hypothetical protein
MGSPPTAATGTTRVDMTTPDLQPKIFHAGDNWVGQPYVFVGQDNIGIIGDLNSGIVITPEYGVGIMGHLSLTVSPDQVSFCGGYWSINPLVLASIGSSSAIPIPWLVPSTPQLLQSTDDLQNSVSTMQGFL